MGMDVELKKREGGRDRQREREREREWVLSSMIIGKSVCVSCSLLKWNRCELCYCKVEQLV